MRRLTCRLKLVLEERGMEQKELSKLSGVREATISEMCRDINKTFPRNVIEQIANALEIDDINSLLSFSNQKDGSLNETRPTVF